MKATTSYNKVFTVRTINWFERTLGQPTDVQREAWPEISSGSHVLVSAPTGTGKTLSAFLVFIDQMMEQAHEGKLEAGLQVIYISPLKSLASDIRENLHRPLDGIAEACDIETPVTVAVRTGDTSASERAKMARKPPHILITTPESLYLLLTSKSGKNMLKTARAIIIDELHAMIDTKRGAHLMLSLARLDVLCDRPLQRVGLSATIRPLDLAADYLSNGDDPVQVVSPLMNKDFEITIENPFPEGGVLPEGTIWPEIAKKAVEACKDSRSVIAFTEGRLMTEQLAFYVNQLAGEGFARAHHGSVSKEQRFEVENDLRAGRLRLLCATSSMELGIDVGAIDKVLQISCPFSIASVMQRLGRAGHNPGRVSLMTIFPRTVLENLYCAIVAQIAREGGIEHSSPPRLCLDVLAQHLVSMAVGSGYAISDVMSLLSRAYPFRKVTQNDVNTLLKMLAGDYEHQRDIPVRPRIHYDRINEWVEGDRYSQMLATSSPGTIPDMGLYAAKTETGVKVGELDEEFVIEQRVGFKFMLGSFAWRITSISKDTVTVKQATPDGARPAWWRHGGVGRKLQTGLAFGGQMRHLTQAAQIGSLQSELEFLGLDQSAADSTSKLIERQLDATGILPDDQNLIAEHFCDEIGLHQIMIHSIYGRQVNAPLAILLAITAKKLMGTDVDAHDDDDGILLMTRGEKALPEGLLKAIKPETARQILEVALPKTALFNAVFRHTAGRALMMGVRQNKRNPLWVQRLRANEMLDGAIRQADHPLIRETKRECLEDYWDLPGLIMLLEHIQAGHVQIRELYLHKPSPLSLPLRRKVEAELVYAYTPTTDHVMATTTESVEEVLQDIEKKLKPNSGQLARVSERRKLPEDEQGLHTLLMIEGDLIAGELPIPLEWFESLVAQKRCLYIEPGLWIAAEHAEVYEQALVNESEEDCQNIVRRALRYRGAMDISQLAERYFWLEEKAHTILAALCQQGNVIMDASLYYHAELYERARRATITERRQVQTVPATHYAALMSSRLRVLAPPPEQLKQAILKLIDRPFSATSWEASLLPTRVNAYCPDLLDKLLSEGELFWRLGDEGLSFHAYADVDWDADIDQLLKNVVLDPDEQLIIHTLRKRGATFMTALSTEKEQMQKSLQEVLFSLMEKGLIHADSFTPIRMWLEKDKHNKNTKASTRRRVASRVATTTAGRWDLCRPLIIQTIEEQLNRAFEKVGLLCRETATPVLRVSWSKALEALRIWEYTGRARRGYFVNGLSGAQYIRDDAYAELIERLTHPDDKIVWLLAPDPNQAWGKTLPYEKDWQFTSVPGTVVALKRGVPVAVFERKGHTLRVFDETVLTEALMTFVETYKRNHIFSTLTRITVKDYPDIAKEALLSVGFVRVMLDYVLHR